MKVYNVCYYFRMISLQTNKNVIVFMVSNYQMFGTVMKSPKYLAFSFNHSLPSFSWDFTLNTLRRRKNGCHFADDTFKSIFVSETLHWI